MWDISKHLDNVAIIEENGNEIRYSKLAEHSKELYSTINQRCLVFCLCTNTYGSVLGYFSFIKNKVVPLMLNADLDMNILTALIEKYRPAYIYLPEELSLFENTTVIYQKFGFKLVKTNFLVDVALNLKLALLLSTSGSTGSPKLVRQSYQNIEANTESIVQYLNITEKDKAITTLPMSYTYGLSVINSHFFVGATLIITNQSIMQKEFWEQLNHYQATSFAGVPYTYEMLDRLRFYTRTLPSLRCITQAGGKLSPNLHLKIAEHANKVGINFIVMYGQTEATARMSYLPASDSINKYGSIGIAIPGGEFKLIDENGDLINTPEKVGELVYYGKNVTLGYAELLSDLSKDDEWNQTLMTGDLAKYDSDGFFYIVGRKKRFLKIFGTRISLDEIESLIKTEFDHLVCAATGKDDELQVFLEVESVVEDVKVFVMKKLGIAKIAIKVIAINEIPKNEAGKILYSQLNKD
jgi:acyl-coenzyme A synthetase/AMP-(fatty) acid ligase